MTHEERIFSYPNGEIQRVQTVTLKRWQDLEFHSPRASDRALDSFARIYEKFLVPACPVLFGTMVLFRLPEGMEVPFPMETGSCGHVADPLTAAAAVLDRNLHFLGKTPIFRDKVTREFYHQLHMQGCVRIVRGLLPLTTIIPVGDDSGFLTESEEAASMKVNGNFFIMDRFDCATAYDHVGIPFGLRVKDGRVDAPPAYDREAFLVKKDGSIEIQPLSVRDLEVEIGGIRYRHGSNCRIYDRLGSGHILWKSGPKIIVVGTRVAAISGGMFQKIPASGFVLCPEGAVAALPGDAVTYHGLEDVAFGIQVGNSIIKNGIKTEKFLSRFYNIRHLQPVAYPPSLYPMNFQKSRAARIALGADADGRPMLLWAEGAGKLRYTPGKDSCGASLSEMADICKAVGMVHAVNLDGGGSAQILLENRRSLRISDRNDDNTECERPVPMGLILR